MLGILTCVSIAEVDVRVAIAQQDARVASSVADERPAILAATSATVVAASLVLAACGGATAPSLADDAGAKDAALDAPTTTELAGTIGGAPAVARGAWAAVSNGADSVGGPWIRVVILDAVGTCDDSLVVPRAGATEVHLFVGSKAPTTDPIGPGRYATNAMGANRWAAIVTHEYDAQCKDARPLLARDGDGWIELDEVGTVVRGRFDANVAGEHVSGSFVAPACPLTGMAPSCL